MRLSPRVISSSAPGVFRLDVLNLLFDLVQPRHVAQQLGGGIGRDGAAFGRAHRTEFPDALRSLGLKLRTPSRVRSAFMPLTIRVNSDMKVVALHGQGAGAPLPQGWGGDHLAVASFAARSQPENPLQQLDIQTIGLGAAMFTRHGGTGGVDDIGFDASGPQPTRQPEAVPPGFEGHSDPLDLLPRFDCFIPPAQQQLEQLFFSFPIGVQLLGRAAFQPAPFSGKPTILTQLRRDNQGERAASIRMRMRRG